MDFEQKIEYVKHHLTHYDRKVVGVKKDMFPSDIDQIIDMPEILELLKKEGFVKAYEDGFGMIKPGGEIAAFGHLEDLENLTVPLEEHINGKKKIVKNITARTPLWKVELELTKLAAWKQKAPTTATHNRRLVKDGEDFFLDGNIKPLKFGSKTSLHYLILKVLYGTDGRDKFLGYRELYQEVRKEADPKPIWETEAEISTNIRNAINNSLFSRVSKKLEDLVQIDRGKGVYFKNPVIN